MNVSRTYGPWGYGLAVHDSLGKLAYVLRVKPKRPAAWLMASVTKRDKQRALDFARRCGLTEYQVAAFDRDGKLIHCGPHAFLRLGPSVIRRYVAQWEQWADGIAAQHPDCGTADSRRKTVYVTLHPIDKPEASQTFVVVPTRKGGGG